MKLKLIFLLTFIVFAAIIASLLFRNQNGRLVANEKTLVGTSLLNTPIYQLTSDEWFASIFYQTPNFFSSDGSEFLFRARGLGPFYLYLVNPDSGAMRKVSSDVHFGWMPAWLDDAQKIYIGKGGAIKSVDVSNWEEEEFSLPTENWISFLDVQGNRILFVEEESRLGDDIKHIGLSVVNTDGSNYRQLYLADWETVFYLDHPMFLADGEILFLTRGVDRDFTGDFNKPWIVSADGGLRQIPVQCSHYDVHPDGDKILCGSEGYVIDLFGNILMSFTELSGHGAWSPDGDIFLMTTYPEMMNEENAKGVITLVTFPGGEKTALVEHQSTYDSSLGVHIQPNAQFSPDGRYVIYESDLGTREISRLYLVELP